MLNKFLKSKKGNVALMTALLAFPLMGAAGLVMDYSYFNRLQSMQQSAVDSAALAAAKELGVANVNPDTLQALAENYVANNLGEPQLPDTMTVTATQTADETGLSVTLSHVWEPMFLHYVNKSALPIVTTATANQAGEGTICMLGLDETAPRSIHLVQTAQLRAPGCGVYSNSSDKNSIMVEDTGNLVSGITCSSGGFSGDKTLSYTPEPITDCPRVSDPLANRIMPTAGSCDHNDFVIDTGVHTLYPGTYCGGLKIGGTAEADLRPGTYVIKDGALEVTLQAQMKGSNVGFFLTGTDAVLSLEKQTSISLTAPETGLMAGLLFLEDPKNAPASLNQHMITSHDARLLLGTIYLPNGVLTINSEGPVADQSAYTAIVARSVKLKEGPTLYLNSNYTATNVPVPKGLVKDRVYLAN